jgi:hypothetical protein
MDGGRLSVKSNDIEVHGLQNESIRCYMVTKIDDERKTPGGAGGF